MKRDFEDIIKSLKKSITPADYFVDYPKIYFNIKDYEVHLNILNTLIGKDNIEDEFIELVSQYPEVMRSIPILLATHEHKFNIINVPCVEVLNNIRNGEYNFFDEQYICYDFNKLNHSIEDYANFLKKSGLLELLQNRKIKNLVDYVIGIEVGLDSNSRKNRSGKIMEDIVEEFFKVSGIEYYKQIKYEEIDEKFGTNFCSIGKATKKFDFVFKSKNNNDLIVMEVNCYGTQGSKPNETAKGYIELNNKVKGIQGAKFVWITDGNGWNRSKLNLEDAYDNIEHLYTIKDLENNILERL